MTEDDDAGGPSAPVYRVVDSLPDLIDADEYARHPEGRLIRIRLTWSSAGLDILGDAFRPDLLERLLEGLGPDEIEQMMCG
ncbi:radical SAM-modified peptide, FtsH ternary system-associated [Streptomyces sp. NPDC048191]|uniref:radical SAM-modified peptide, FtsH ternary system-associated n=1 Tax=Streptomyces sp. NPDC048191 TaxID=3155484 RepID=UPI0033C98D45